MNSSKLRNWPAPAIHPKRSLAMLDICRHNTLARGPSGTRQGFQYQSMGERQEPTPVVDVQSLGDSSKEQTSQ